MAYFSNGTEGEWYEEKICERCAHYRPPDGEATCPIWMLHLLHNGAQGEMGETLDLLIPQDGIYTGLCSMWHPSKPEYKDHGKNYQEWLADRRVKND